VRAFFTRCAVPLVSLLAFGSVAAPAQTLAIVGGTIIDGTGAGPVANGVVVMTNGRITAVGPAASVSVPSGATRIDARGKYVIPGLMDANLHLGINIDLETLIRLENRYDEIVLEAAQIALKTGQTTVFDTWGPLAALVKVRDRIDAGQEIGSRIFLAGNIIGFSGPLGPDFYGVAAPHVSKAFAKRINDAWEQGTGRELLWMSPDSVRARIRAYTKTGVDFLKYGASGHVEMNLIAFSERVQRVIVEEGHRAGMTVQTHVTSLESLDMAIEAGVDIITHGDISGPVYPIPPETIKKLVDRGISVSVLAITDQRLAALEKAAPEGVLTPYMKIAKQNNRNMAAAGVKLMASTDAGIANPILGAESKTRAADTVDARVALGEGHFNALVALEQAGMQPMEILKSATSNIARAYHKDDLLGTLETGKAADLVILDANPLEGARNYRRISAVVKGGKVVDRDVLPTRPVISSLEVPKQP